MWEGLFIFIIIILGLWLITLTYFFWNLSTHYNHLIKNSNSASLQSLLEGLVADVEKVKRAIDLGASAYATIEKESATHLQKVKLRRFNPFDDTGGDQSFVLVLVDGKNSGVVISSLYSRSGTRWYAKEVVEGKGVEHTLSDEEEKALKDVRRAEL